ncbi:hypothetical protein J5N97_017077 [Dioscorea zingiberensis]|uniref:FAF domain-containing protein n=1 Tax=Dioscorea zingiberensis TaxID=325984 RepID=A0A9D5CL87_9LILI|nr:hypothetical protein J5N97_017077 [Dioscorea zingiberensis]
MQTSTPSSPSIKLLEAPGLKTLPDYSHVHTPMSANIINRAPLLSLSTVLEEPTTEVFQDRDHEDDDEHDDVDEENVCWGTYGRRTVLKFPPPITHLAMTCKLKCQLPWVWERSYKDGRLVLRQVPVIQHEYMQAQRKNGRLTLQLIQKNDYLVDFIKRMELKEKDQNSVVLESCELDKSTEEGKEEKKEVKKVIQVKTMDENYCSSSMEINMPKTETVLVECQALCA